MPYSCAAWIASIQRGVDVARAIGLTHVVGSTGDTSEKAAMARLGLPIEAYLDMGDFVGGLLKYVKRQPGGARDDRRWLRQAGASWRRERWTCTRARSTVDFEMLAALLPAAARGGAGRQHRQ